MIRGYLRLIVFAAGLLIGVQVPSLVDQYHKRVDAHFLEAQQNLSGFQSTADQFFGGDLQQLIQHYATSDDPVIKKDSASVRAIYDRFQLLQNERAALDGAWYAVAWHVAFRHDPALFAETLAQYSYTVPLDPTAIAWGVGIGFLAALIVELLALAVWTLLGRVVGRAARMRHA